MSLGVHILFYFLGWIPRSGWPDHLIDIFLTFQELPNCFLEWTFYFIFTSGVSENFRCPMCMQTKLHLSHYLKQKKTPKYVFPETFPDLLCPVLKTEMIPTASSSFVQRYCYILCSDGFTYLCAMALSASWGQGTSIPFS